MSALHAALWVWVALILLMSVVWLAAKRSRWAVIDVAWTFSLAINALLFCSLVNAASPFRKWLVAAIVVAWSLRLGLHLCQRLSSHQGDDPRYATLADKWGAKANARMYWFFQFQGIISLLLSMAIFVAMLVPAPRLTTWDYAGLAWALLSILGEMTADRQLRRFKMDPGNGGKVCKSGLWRYSRHPNYFFECSFWLGLFIVSLGGPYALLALLSPAIMLYTLLKLTGIPAAEAQALKSKGDAYRYYQAETSVFIPWFPKKNLRGNES